MTEHETSLEILRLCRSRGFKTRAVWGMRQGVKLDANANKTPCAIIDLMHTQEKIIFKPKRTLTYVPICLASGNTWLEVYEKLVAAGEISL